MNINRSLATRAGLAIAGIVAFYVLITTMVSFITTLLPIIAVGAVGYLGYRALTKRTANKQNATVSQQQHSPQARPKTVERQPEIKLDDDVTAEDFLRELPKPDLSRLEEKEQQAPQVTDAVRAQLEERRKRLGK